MAEVCLQPKPTFLTLCAWLSCQSVSLSCWADSLLVNLRWELSREGDRCQPPPIRAIGSCPQQPGTPGTPIGRLLYPQALQANEPLATCLCWAWRPNPRTVSLTTLSPGDSTVTDSAHVHSWVLPAKCTAGATPTTITEMKQMCSG